jgi:2-deoxy-D-gluconate 3-dehydrogenase
MRHSLSFVALRKASRHHRRTMILDLFKLDGRVAVVTGGRRGLGQSMAWGLAEAGADIVCVSKHGQADETRRLVENV